MPLDRELRASALIFAGHVARVEYGGARVTFTVYESWRRRAAEEVIVETSGGCGYFVEPGGDYIIFARRYPGFPYLQMRACSHNTALLCAADLLKTLGRPAVRYRPLPDFRGWGTDEHPLTQWNLCGAREPVRPPNADYGLPQGVWIRDFAATVYADGSVHDVQIKLGCLPHVADQCTPERERATRERIETWRYKPAELFGRPVAYKIEWRRRTY